MLNLLFAISDFGFDFMNVFIYIILSLAFANGIYEYEKKHTLTEEWFHYYGKHVLFVASVLGGFAAIPAAVSCVTVLAMVAKMVVVTELFTTIITIETAFIIIIAIFDCESVFDFSLLR